MELLELVTGIEKDETVTALEELLKIYLEQEVSDREAIGEKIHELVDSLSNSEHIRKSTLVKIKMLVSDIAKNWKRVKEIVNRFNQAGNDKKMRLWVIKQFAKEGLITQQQYCKLVEEIDEVDIKRLTDIIKEFKIGGGLDFMPRKTDKLIDTLQEWLEELVEKGSTILKNKIAAVMNELLRRKQISEERYHQIKE